MRGEIRVDVLTDFPERRFAPGSRLFLGAAQDDPAPRPVEVLAARPHKSWLLVALDVAADRAAAATMTGHFLLVPAEDAGELEPETYYPHELIGCEVVTDAGESLGRVESILETGSADVLAVRRDGASREVLLPMIGDVVRAIDVAGRRIEVTLLPGLLD